MRHPWFSFVAIFVLSTLFACGVCTAYGQNSGGAMPQTDITVPAENTQNSGVAPNDVPDNENNSNVRPGLNFLSLMMRGGWFMIPLALLSVLVIALAIERSLALRQERMLPRRLVDELGHIAADENGFNPRRAYKACQTYPSAASRVIQAMLLKAGRPQPEIENAVSECAQREANKLHNVVSWLTLAAAVAPLIGLLGTVWGITQAFYETTQMGPGEDKSTVLAQGIYTSLVTTLCGLTIAIPAAVLAHIFENRIVGWFNRIEEMVANLTPQLEPLEGRMRTVARDDSPRQDLPRHDEARRARPVTDSDAISSANVPR